MAKRKVRGEAAIAGFDPFHELLALAVAKKAERRRNNNPKEKARLEAEVRGYCLDLLPYCKPRLSAVEAKVEGAIDLTVEIGSSD